MSFYFEGPWYIVAAILLIIVLLIMKKKYKVNNVFLLFFSLVTIYLSLVAKYTLFPITIIPEIANRKLVLEYVNLVPFHLFSLKNAIGNIILTMPFGFLFPLVKIVQNKRTILIWSILLPVIIEGLQFTIAIITGIPERLVDTTDIIFNCAGVLIGFSIFLVFTKVLNMGMCQKQDNKFDQLLLYIIERNYFQKQKKEHLA